MALKSMKFDEKKFMWDGTAYATEDEAKNAEKKYEEDGFEVRTIKEKDHFEVYTRRVVTEIVLEGEAPI
jgi:hypothetical protein